MKKFSLSMNDINSFPLHIPIEVSIRLALNAAGFEFEDDGKLSSVVNLNPKPLGDFKCWYDAVTLTQHYQQSIKTK